MRLFLWNQRECPTDSRELLRRAVLQYETAKPNRVTDRESVQDSLFEFKAASGGKPVVVAAETGHPVGIEVSVTHTGDWWLCAVGEHPVGIDAELRKRKINPLIARRVCAGDEKLWLGRGTAALPGENAGKGGQDEPESDEVEVYRRKLLWLWVRKEAYTKYLGTGIAEGLNTFSVIELEERGCDMGNGGAGQRAGWREKNGFRTVNFGTLSEEAERELLAAVYSPEEAIEGVEWLKRGEDDER